MLGLLAATPREWVARAEADLTRLLLDHAHCEVKAAQNAISLVARYGGEYPALVQPLLELAREEAEHIGLVHDRLAARGATLGAPNSDAYVVALRRAANAAPSSAHALMDRLLVAALIEARSCERFKLLSEHLQDASLRSFYHDLMVSEARHAVLFTRLAEACFGVPEVRARSAVLARLEGELAEQLPLGPSVHG